MALLLLMLFACWLAGRIAPVLGHASAHGAPDSVTSWSSINEQGDDHLLRRPRHACRDPRRGPGGRDLHRTRTSSRGRWQHLQGPGLESAPRHAILVR